MDFQESSTWMANKLTDAEANSTPILHPLLGNHPTAFVFSLIAMAKVLHGL